MPQAGRLRIREIRRQCRAGSSEATGLQQSHRIDPVRGSQTLPATALCMIAARFGGIAWLQFLDYAENKNTKS